jgi:hypothetical protein
MFVKAPMSPCVVPAAAWSTLASSVAACAESGARGDAYALVSPATPLLRGTVSMRGVLERQAHILSDIALSGRNAAKASFRSAYWKLDPADRARLHEVITDTAGKLGRSLSFSLHTPIEIDGQIYRALRCKGIAPQRNASGELFGHNGCGYDSRPLFVSDDGVVSVGTPTHSPEGTILFERARREFEAAVHLGVDLTDGALGFGAYEDLLFQGQPAGFMIYAMREVKDRRFADGCLRPAMEAALESGAKFPLQQMKPDADFGDILFHLGRAMRLMHKRGLVHRYPHFNNVGIEAGSVVLRDLDGVITIAQMPPAQRLGYVLIDFVRIVYECFGMYSAFFTDPFSIFCKGYFGESMDEHEVVGSEIYFLTRELIKGQKKHARDWFSEAVAADVRAFGERLIEMYAPEL